MMTYTAQQSGFSLVETLVAITILLIVIVGPMSISSSVARSTSFSSEQVVAFFLAQEGAELAQKARDDFILKAFLSSSDANYNATPWVDFADDSVTGDFYECFTAQGCALEIDDDAAGTVQVMGQCSGTGADCRLFFDDGGNRQAYTHVGAGNELTPYLRVINFERMGDRSIAVRSRVLWRTGSQRQSQEVEVETYLFNVYGN